MRHEFRIKMLEVVEKISSYIGNVCDLVSVKNAIESKNN